MDLDGTLIVSVVVMLAVIASMLRDLHVYRRRRDRAEAYRAATVVATARVAEAVRDELPAVSLAGAMGDPDPIGELAERLGALRLLGLDHVRTAHPLFRGPADGNAAPALSFEASTLEAAIDPRHAAPPRPPRHGRLRSTAALRLVVSRTARP
jgi:hypothetical protein